MVELLTTFDGARQATPPLAWLRGPVKPARQVLSALDRVRRAPAILSAIRLMPEVLEAVDGTVRDGRDSHAMLEPLLEAIEDPQDTVAGLAAVHALARVPGSAALGRMAQLIDEARPGFEAHASWAISERPASADLVAPLVRAVRRGGVSGMHAQAALSRWSASIDAIVLLALETELGHTTDPDARRYLVETIGLVPGPKANASLARISTDGDEDEAVRAAAVSAFAERLSESLPLGLAGISGASGHLGATIRTVRAQRRLARRGPLHDPRRHLGMRVAQIHLAAALGTDATDAGAGDAGGVASLLSQLGPALAEQPRLAEVITIGRAPRGQTQPSSRAVAGQRHERIALHPNEGATFSGRWPAVMSAARAIRAALLADYLPHVIHLRMADPGSLAAAGVARELGIPTVFTLAPDPHGPIAAAEADGTLDRRSFASEDAAGALWFRTNLVERLAREARELVLFPRHEASRRLLELTGVDIESGPPRHTIVPEGVDVARADAAASAIKNEPATPGVIRDLERRISALPRERHGLPLVISVGRMHQGKGMARLVEAFAQDERLSRCANLVIVGGDLEHPAAPEAAELARIRLLFERHPSLAQRVVLLGHRLNTDVALVLAAARFGRGRLIGTGGAYASGSIKEEFGLALLEAMAAGLPVVAPRRGGPATYVQAGVTGELVDTADPGAIAAGLISALELATVPATAERARDTVAERFTLGRMARTLAAVYRITAGASTLAQPVVADDDAEMGVAA